MRTRKPGFRKSHPATPRHARRGDQPEYTYEVRHGNKTRRPRAKGFFLKILTLLLLLAMALVVTG